MLGNKKKEFEGMGLLDGRVAIITGAGRGLGREHALLFAAEGAKVVVNDLGGDSEGKGSDQSPAEQTVADIVALGGEAIVNGDDVADWDAAKRMVDAAIETFGGLDVLVNNAGILRDRVIANMTEAEWDDVVEVHLRGHFCPTHHAATYWRDRAKAGTQAAASLIHTSSSSGLFANAGQANYGAAKSGIATFSQICAKELGRYGVRSNSIAPGARTRLTNQVGRLVDVIKPPEDADVFDEWDPANVSPLVAFLATEDCGVTGETFFVQGGTIQRVAPWARAETIQKDERWTIREIAAQVANLGVLEG